MAQWKKIIVSGSNAELQSLVADSLLQVSNNQIISSSAADTKLSGSFSGSFSGDGSGLTGVVATNGASLTQGTGITAFSYNGATSQTVSISGSAQLSNDIITKWNSTDGKFVNSSITDNGTVISGASSIQLTGANSILTGSFTGSFVGDGSGLTGLVTNLAISGSTGNDTIDLLTEALTITGSLPISTTVSNNTVTISAADATTTTKGVASFNSNEFTVSSGAVSLANSGTGAVLAINGTTNEVDVNRTNGTVTVGLPDNVVITQGITAATGSITGDLTVGGDLVVNGTVTTINTADLEVRDRFILLNSGSASGTAKGGIIIDGGSGAGNTFLYNNDANQQRWGFNRNVASGTQTGVTSEVFAAAVISGEAGQFDGFYDKPGNIRVDGSGDIFIYV
jgi:hypothetical protein